MRPTRSRIVMIALTAAVAGQLAWATSVLPARVASHFDFAGRPNGWMSRDGFLAVTAALAVLFSVLPLLVGMLVRVLPPELVNLPNRNWWLAPPRREEGLRRLAAAMEWLAALVLALLGGITQLAVMANLKGHAFSSWLAGALLLAFLAGMAAWCAALYRLFPKPTEPAFPAVR